MKRVYLLSLLGIFIFFLDQISKYYIDKKLALYQWISIIPGFLRITKTYNKGVVFGFLNSSKNPFITILITIISITALLILIFLFFKSENHFFSQILMVFIIAGAFGNIFDRIVRGKVVDFIEVYYKNWSYPIFNIADSFITVGVILLIFVELFWRKDASNIN